MENHIVRPDVDQKTLLKNICSYLQLERGAENEITKKFLSAGGYCAGISTLWLYSRWLQDQPKILNNVRDDHDWFASTVKRIARWDGKEKLSEEDANEFERFISLIEFFHHPSNYLPMHQGDLDDLIEDTTGRKLNKEFAIGSLLTLEQLKMLLKTENVIRDGELVYIELGLGRHITALFRKGNYYYYFNPDNPTGEIKSDSLDEIADRIFEANSNWIWYPMYERDKPLPLGIRIFSFDEMIEKPYPTPKEILDNVGGGLVLEPELLEYKKAYANGISGLIMAVKVGSLEIVQYMLERKSKLDFQTQRPYGWNALMVAAYFGKFEIAEYLLKTHKKDIDLEAMNDDYENALMYAAANGHKEIVRLLLDNGAKPDALKDLSQQKKTALIWAARNGHKEIVELLLKSGANPAIMEGVSINETALMFAAKNGHLEIVRLLLENPLVIKIVNIQSGCESIESYEEKGIGNTPLMWAAKNGHLEIVKSLIASGGDLTLINTDKKNAYALALENKHEDVCHFIDECTKKNIVNKEDKNEVVNKPPIF